MRVAMCQLKVTADKAWNIENAAARVKEAADRGARLVILPECFNSPYGTKYFPEYAEEIPTGATSTAMARVAKEEDVFLIAGSIAERDATTGNLFNTCAVYNPHGILIGLYRKMHLFKINTPQVTFDESETLSAGETCQVVEIEGFRIGLGICFDVRYPQLALVYAQMKTDLIVYPGAFNMVTGPCHWSLLARSRAVDAQQFVVMCSPARDEEADYVAYGHSMAVDPWGNVMAQADDKPQILHFDVDLTRIRHVRRDLPILDGTRHDIYKLVLNS
eukprot:gene20600-31719_t